MLIPFISLPNPTLMRSIGVLGVLIAIMLPAFAVAQDDSADPGVPISGQFVDDRAGVLSVADIADLDQLALQVRAAGAEPFMLIRLLDADQDETIEQAEQLLADRRIESELGAEDGLVILVNLRPDEPERGEIATSAGQTLLDGNLPPDEQARILDDEVLPRLRDNDLVGGLAAGLEAIESSLIDGPPVSAASEWAQGAVDSWLIPVAAVLSLAGAVPAALLWSRRSIFHRQPQQPMMTPPNALPPALAGVLVNHAVDHQAVSATILDLAGRGALLIEPEPWHSAGEKDLKVQIRLGSDAHLHHDFERELWHLLFESSRDSIVSHDEFTKLQSKWKPIRESIERESDQRDWFDGHAIERRNWLFAIGTGTFVLGFAAFIVTAIAEDFGGFVAVVPLAVVAVASVGLAASYPRYTRNGKVEARQWRNYRAGIVAAGKDQHIALNLDQALPYAVALGATGDIDDRLKAAGDAGRVPTIFRHAMSGQQGSVANFMPYWIAFHAVSTPASTSSTTMPTTTTSSSGAGGSF